jgi:hypothetical protein
MKTVLLAYAADPYAVSTHRCRLSDRLRARLFALGLDRALADGASPDLSVLLSLRAETLLTVANRRSLARALRRIAKDAEGPPHPLGAMLPLARREIVRHRDLMRGLAEAVERAGPIDLRGLAAVEVLLRDGTGPVYSSEVVGVLGPRLQAVLEMLSVPPAGSAVP